MIYVVKINQTEYEVEVERGKANIVRTTDVVVPTAVTPIAPVQPVPSPAAQPAVSAAEGSTIVKSPMPGTILEVKVKPGMRVKRGDILLILEAMKMENEVVASVDGIVGQIYIAKGASVNTNDILVAIQ